MRQEDMAYYKNKNQKEIPEDIERLLVDLESKDGMKRLNARRDLVSMGKEAVKFLEELINHPKRKIRWEAVKVLSQIADPKTGPLFIAALKDEESEVRWIATEGLIALGREGVLLLLKEMFTNPKSEHVLKGAHHVLKKFSENESSEDINELLRVIEGSEAETHVPIIAERLYRKFK